MSRCRHRARAFLLASSLIAVAWSPATGQERPGAPRDPNGHPFRTPSGAPTDPIHRIALVSVERDGFSRRVAFTDLGDRLGFWIHRAPSDDVELAGAIAGGAQSRFDLEESDNEFIEIHFRLSALLRARFGRVAARAELYHVSSHLGDEFLARTGREPVSTSREGLDLLAQIALARGLVIYGGPGFVLRSSEGFRSPSFRGGVDWELARRGLRPFASIDVTGWSELDWDPTVALEAGVALGRRVRIGLLGGFGPSRAEQFFREAERVIGVSVSYKR
ncbi:MAG: DUF1207 domain-containing protein [Gemmatimonadetes bacterium]|nr:DUF1207 domain-containing protein [Gemmatimonadota bacterium]